jgi:hypothetical protein
MKSASQPQVEMKGSSPELNVLCGSSSSHTRNQDSARKQACVEIGAIPISLSTTHEEFFDLLQQRYEGFLSQSPPQATLEFEIINSSDASDEDVRVTRQGSEPQSTLWQITRGDFSARWNPNTGTGQVRQNANPYSLDSVLRILHSLILADRGGFLLHAASAICGGRAFLFSGISGAGKTTISRLAPTDVTLLTDEISYIRPANQAQTQARTQARTKSAQESSSYQAFGTPFAGELARSGENTGAPIEALFFLEQGPENRIDELSSAEAVRRLMRNILFFAEDPRLVEQLLATACDFVARVPILRLTFYPDARVWDLVRNFETCSSAQQNPVEEPAHV